MRSETLAPVAFSSATVEWATPVKLFRWLDSEFHFDVDVCATAENAKCAHFYTKEQDGLSQEWRGVVWMNPPYGKQIAKWVQKAHETARLGLATVVCLLPARTDTSWWHKYCMSGEVRFLRGRLAFNDGKNPAPFPSALVIFKAAANLEAPDAA